MAQCGSVVRCCFAVGSQSGRFLRCSRRMLGDSGCVTAPLRVVRQSAMVGYAVGHQVVENSTVHLLPTRRRHRLLDHLTGEFVQERHVVTRVEEYPQLDAFVRNAAAVWPDATMSSGISARCPITEAAPRTALACEDSRAARASTASRTDGGSWPVSVERISVTKKGFPPVRSCTLPASSALPVSCTSRATPCGDSNGTCMRATLDAAARSPITRASG